MMLSGDDVRPATILHVVEAYGGGVMNVIHDYIAAAPEYDHYILATPRKDHDTGSAAGVSPSRVLSLPKRPASAIRCIGRTVRELKPAIVHAHSSKAGAYLRLCPSVPTDSIYYTPHCFAFERQDVSRTVRAGYRLIERLLVRRTGHFVAVSERELQLAYAFPGNAKGTYVPNIATIPRTIGRHSRESLTAVAVGRVSAQKDPQFFLDMVRASDATAGIKWVWLGDGPSRFVDALREAGVEVSGWLPRDEVLRRMRSAAVYVHTASWEGSPLTILEASRIGLPLVVRDTPATASLGLDELVETPNDGARAVEKICASEPHPVTHERFLARHSPEIQIRNLTAAYHRATGVTQPPPPSPAEENPGLAVTQDLSEVQAGSPVH